MAPNRPGNWTASATVWETARKPERMIRPVRGTRGSVQASGRTHTAYQGRSTGASSMNSSSAHAHPAPCAIAPRPDAVNAVPSAARPAPDPRPSPVPSLTRRAVSRTRAANTTTNAAAKTTRTTVSTAVSSPCPPSAWPRAPSVARKNRVGASHPWCVASVARPRVGSRVWMNGAANATAMRTITAACAASARARRPCGRRHTDAVTSSSRCRESATGGTRFPAISPRLTVPPATRARPPATARPTRRSLCPPATPWNSTTGFHPTMAAANGARPSHTTSRSGRWPRQASRRANRNANVHATTAVIATAACAPGEIVSSPAARAATRNGAMGPAPGGRTGDSAEWFMPEASATAATPATTAATATSEDRGREGRCTGGECSSRWPCGITCREGPDEASGAPERLCDAAAPRGDPFRDRAAAAAAGLRLRGLVAVGVGALGAVRRRAGSNARLRSRGGPPAALGVLAAGGPADPALREPLRPGLLHRDRVQPRPALDQRAIRQVVRRWAGQHGPLTRAVHLRHHGAVREPGPSAHAAHALEAPGELLPLRLDLGEHEDPHPEQHQRDAQDPAREQERELLIDHGQPSRAVPADGDGGEPGRTHRQPEHLEVPPREDGALRFR